MPNYIHHQINVNSILKKVTFCGNQGNNYNFFFNFEKLNYEKITIVTSTNY